MFKKNLAFFVLFNVFPLNCLFFQDEEKILSFESYINVHKDASIIIEEKITVFSEGINIKRGIFRDFPTIYYDNLKNKYIVDFEILDIKRDGKNENYFIKNLNNGKRIYIGNTDQFITPGIHVYQITYKTNRQIGFFKSWDELYWNVTGNGWIFPIKKVIAIISLPNEVAQEKKIDFDYYTGFLDSKEKNAIGKIIGNKVFIETTKPLRAYEGLTIDVIWQKGIVQEPTFWQKIYYFLNDNKVIIWLIICIISILVYYFYIYFKIRNPILNPIIPLFNPPEKLSPGQIRFINKMKYDHKLLTSEILQMAIKGYISIDYQKGIYILNKKNEPENEPYYQDILIRLFSQNDKLILNKSSAKIINRTIENIKTNLYRLQKEYFVSFNKYLSLGILFSILAILPAFFENIILFFICIIILSLINLIFSYLLKQYTYSGNKIIAQIRGFKMFLSASEKERINFFAEPERTPEIFEIYLPYAVALDVEKKWTRQFKSVFDKLKEQNIKYVPLWYYGPRFDILHMSNMTIGLNNSINNIISSSIPPGTSSGFSSKGSSGRGGGGGGW